MAQALDTFLRGCRRLNRWVARLCALLVGAMVLIVLFGVLARYVLELGITWTEELARYVMIWAALLAISVGAANREHIGFELLFSALPPRLQRPLRILLDLVGIGFFVFLAVFGVGMTVRGTEQYATIFGMSMALPFASVPVAAALTALQSLAVLLRDLYQPDDALPGAPLEEAA
ncbi:MAG TPA: TRAP transporter small permease [Gammaproteobacteria bacterium]